MGSRPPGALPHGNPAAAPDETLIALARAGDRRAFDALVQRYRPRVFALALHLTGSAADADDVVQDTFVRAFRRLDRFEGRSRFFTWLYRIALNRALSRTAETGRRRTAPFDDERVRAAVSVDAMDDPRRAYELQERYALLVEALDRLSPSLRATLILVVIHGLEQREAAAILGCREGTVGWRLHEARARLRTSVARLSRDPTPLPRRRALPSLEELIEKWCAAPRGC